jgi:hypothetical protein
VQVFFHPLLKLQNEGMAETYWTFPSHRTQDNEGRIYIYVGKTYQNQKESRFDQHFNSPDKKELGWTRETHEFIVLDRGHWTIYETAIWEERYILLNGGINGPGGKTSKLVNDVHAIDQANIVKYAHLHDPCR